MARSRIPEQHEGKRKEILDAAHRCFLRHGLQGASISMICKEVGISAGHLYHYFPSKDAIIEQMANEYLSKLHTYFERQQDSEDVATILLSEIWSMTSWDDTEHCRILFELLAESGRNDRVRYILADNTKSVRQLLAQTLKSGQTDGKVDPDLNPDHTAAMLIAIVDAVPMLPLMVPGISFEESRKLLSMMVRRFLHPGDAET
jgi:AcrR family transcriptional regulator